MPEYISFVYLLNSEDGDVVCIGGPNEEKALFYDLNGKYLKTDLCPAYEKHEKDQKILEEKAGNFFYYRDYALRYSEGDPDKGAILSASDPDTFYLGDISVLNSCFDSADGLFIGSIQEEGEVPDLFVFDLKKSMIIARRKLTAFQDKYTGFMAFSEDKALICVDDWAANGDSLQTICIWDYKQDAVEESIELTPCFGKELETMAEEKLLSMNESFPMTFHLDEQPYEDAFGFIRPATLGISTYGKLNLLSVIEEELLKFPEGLLSEIPCDQFDGIDVFIVKKIEDNSVGAYADNVNGMLYVVFAEDTFNRGDVSHEFMHLMEWRLLYHYKDQKDDIDAIWNKFNPEGFEYMWDDWVSADVDEERDAYFYSAYGMKSEWEDKATIFAAMFDNNGWPFETYAPLRKKAEKLCELIRECYPSCKDRTDLCWEAWMQEKSD